MKVFVHRNLKRLTTEFLLVDERNGRRSFGLPVVITMKTEDEADENTARPLEPTFALDDRATQSLFQALWDQGLRPESGSSGKAETDALKGHIAFAEKIATALLPKP